jgi:hypothetical protein
MRVLACTTRHLPPARTGLAARKRRRHADVEVALRHRERAVLPRGIFPWAVTSTSLTGAIIR